MQRLTQAKTKQVQGLATNNSFTVLADFDDCTEHNTTMDLPSSNLQTVRGQQIVPKTQVLERIEKKTKVRTLQPKQWR